jgi:hypothetical protein
MQSNDIAERFRIPGAAGWLAAIDAPLGFKRPFLPVLKAEKRVVDILSLSSDLDAPGTRLEPGEGRHGVCAPRAVRRRRGAKIVASWRRNECTRGELTNFGTRKMKLYQAHRFAVAPMMDRTDNYFGLSLLQDTTFIGCLLLGIVIVVLLSISKFEESTVDKAEGGLIAQLLPRYLATHEEYSCALLRYIGSMVGILCAMSVVGPRLLEVLAPSLATHAPPPLYSP